MVRTVAVCEFITTVKKKTYYLVTLGMPLIVVAYGGVIALITVASFSGDMEEMAKPIGVVDRSRILTGPGGVLHDVAVGETHEFPDQPFEGIARLEKKLGKLGFPTFERKLQRFDDLASAQAELVEGTLSSVVVIPEDYLEQGKVEKYMKKRSLIDSGDDLGFLATLMTEHLLRQARLPDSTIERIQDRPEVVEFELDENHNFVEVDLWSKGFSQGIPLGVGILLIVALMMNASLLLSSVAEEKENKVIEVILSSVSADQLLFGKVLGQVAAGLLQIVIWMAMVGVIPLITVMFIDRPIEIDVDVIQLILGGVFIVLGFIFYGCLLVGLGSMGSTYRDCQQLTVVVILCACVPMMTWMAFVNNPDGAMSRTLSIIPLFSPAAMMLRLSVAEVAWWEVGLSLAILVAAIWAAVKISARLFRVGTLLYGKRPGLREIWKALRQPA